MIYFCAQQKRRALVLQHQTLNGIDYLEVCDSGPDCGCGKQLQLTLLKDARAALLSSEQLQIAGGAADAQVYVIEIIGATVESPKTITLILNAPGDFSSYTFSLVGAPGSSDPPDGFDPQLSTVDFSFKAGCNAPGDCEPDSCCGAPHRTEPDINYLAKEFDGFNQVMLDRLAVLVPDWRESHPSDIGIALVETLAYVADRLSYQQDAVATEAYLRTARSRISLRRHARLVDYRVDEGANARTWVHLNVSQDGLVIPVGTALYPSVPGLPVTIKPGHRQAKLLPLALTFQTMHAATLHTEQNELDFYTWGDVDCCLQAGSTNATLQDHPATLQVPGTILIFEEIRGPKTGNPDDADPAKRWVVRLTRVQQTDYLNRPLIDPLNGTPVTRIWWDVADALPFSVCISSPAAGKNAVSVARGNMIRADHGAWQDWEDLGDVPAAPAPTATTTACLCGTQDLSATPLPRYYPQLSQSTLTFAAPLDLSGAASAFLASPTPSLPQLELRDDRNDEWTVLADLLKSTSSDPVAVPEIERDGTVFLRFGDNEHGLAANSAKSFQARYRVGNGSMGNIAHDSLGHIVSSVDGIVKVRNPLTATGGRDPETMEHIRQRAPFAFRTQLRAVTEDDYGEVTQRDPAIREARGTLRWTGSWYTASVSIDAVDGSVPSPVLASTTTSRLDLMRMAGVDLEVEPAILVGLRIELNICVDREHFQSDVRDAVMRVFTTGDQCSGQRGVLNPENFIFGQTIYTSPLLAAAQAVEGVASVTLTVFQRMDDPTFDGGAQGFLNMHRLEIARCDNDPNRLDRGILLLHIDGGK